MARTGFLLIEARAGRRRGVCRTVAAPSPSPLTPRAIPANLLRHGGVRVAAASRVRCIRQPRRSDVGYITSLHNQRFAPPQTVPGHPIPGHHADARLLLLLSMWLLSAAGVARAEGDWTGTLGDALARQRRPDDPGSRRATRHRALSAPARRRIEGKTRVDVRGSCWRAGGSSARIGQSSSRCSAVTSARSPAVSTTTIGGPACAPCGPTHHAHRPDLSRARRCTSFVIAGNPRARAAMTISWGAARKPSISARRPVSRRGPSQLRHVHSLFTLIDLTTFRYGHPDPPPGADSATLRLERSCAPTSC